MRAPFRVFAALVLSSLTACSSSDGDADLDPGGKNDGPGGKKGEPLAPDAPEAPVKQGHIFVGEIFGANGSATESFASQANAIFLAGHVPGRAPEAGRCAAVDVLEGFPAGFSAGAIDI